jgi:hypothetical protein
MMEMASQNDTTTTPNATGGGSISDVRDFNALASHVDAQWLGYA